MPNPRSPPIRREQATRRYGNIISGNFSGKLKLQNGTEDIVRNEAGDTYSQNFFWTDPNHCKIIQKAAADLYQVIDRCNHNAVINNITEKEVYSVYGYKLDDLPLFKLNINLQSGNPGDIQILYVVSEGEHLTKRIIKD